MMTDRDSDFDDAALKENMIDFGVERSFKVRKKSSAAHAKSGIRDRPLNQDMPTMGTREAEDRIKGRCRRDAMLEGTDGFEWHTETLQDDSGDYWPRTNRPRFDWRGYVHRYH
jgi:hypothetical protein